MYYAFQIPVTANAEVLAATPPSSEKRKRGQSSDYFPERLKIARFAVENGNSAAARNFLEHLGNH